MGKIILPGGLTVRTADDVWKVLFIFPAMGLGFFSGNQFSGDILNMPYGIFWGGAAGLAGWGIWALTRKLSLFLKLAIYVLFTGGLTAVLLWFLQHPSA
ncbi:MAG TPA: hypothetical protein VI112_00150 [Bacteroidia bacterium]|jgi:hypothetical protein